LHAALLKLLYNIQKSVTSSTSPSQIFQGISFKLADMATEIMAAELLTMQAADLKNRGKKMTKEAAMAKYYASEVAVKNRHRSRANFWRLWIYERLSCREIFSR
jgi:alkylation response protein AidB-like acyl-CoA dehydrogenase